MREAIDATVAAARCSIPALAASLTSPLLADAEVGPLLKAVLERLGADGPYLLQSLVRVSFLIEPDKNGAGTKLDSRWGSRLVATDPRRASFETCQGIFLKLLGDVASALDDSRRMAVLRAFQDHGPLPYFLPVDYLSQTATPMHHAENIGWLWDRADVVAAIALRAMVRDARFLGEQARAVARVLDDKVKVKTYQTDRAQTGEFKTNREKRWEAHPGSPQFATRADCILAEEKLLTELLYMAGFPAELRANLGGVLRVAEQTRCPITLDPLAYAELVTEVLDPTHGKSRFQVGHLNPLKSGDVTGIFGHTPANVSWVTEDGNRIQGYLTLAEVRALITRIARNYQAYSQQVTQPRRAAEPPAPAYEPRRASE